MIVTAEDLEDWKENPVTRAVIKALEGQVEVMREKAIDHFLKTGEDLQLSMGWPLRTHAVATDGVISLIAEATPDAINGVIDDI
ncbi:MAG: hypothetical protein AAFU68_02755 [Pseudomonadota bacterium]